jgi:hypothetical protein
MGSPRLFLFLASNGKSIHAPVTIFNPPIRIVQTKDVLEPTQADQQYL